MSVKKVFKTGGYPTWASAKMHSKKSLDTN